MPIRTSSGGDGAVFSFYVGNLPPHWGWQDLKDLVELTSKTGWTEVPTRPDGQSKRYGWFPVKLKNNPFRLFNNLREKVVDGHRLSVAYFDTSGDRPVFQGCNCTDLANCQHQYSQPSPPSTIVAPSQPLINPALGMPIAMYSPVTLPVPPQQVTYGSPMAPMCTSSTYTFPPRSHVDGITANMANLRLSSQPRLGYTCDVNGAPVNMTRGVVPTEATSIHITGLSPRTQIHILEDHLSTRGSVPRTINLRKHRSNGKSRGNATATYSNPREAATAVERLNRTELDGQRLRVKLDSNQLPRESRSGIGSASGRTGRTTETRQPVVVNGSTGKHRSNS